MFEIPGAWKNQNKDKKDKKGKENKEEMGVKILDSGEEEPAKKGLMGLYDDPEYIEENSEMEEGGDDEGEEEDHEGDDEEEQEGGQPGGDQMAGIDGSNQAEEDRVKAYYKSINYITYKDA